MPSFPYQKNLRGDFFPVIPVYVSNSNKTLEISTLVDSGAMMSVFKSNVARFLEITIEKGKEIYLGGVGGRIKGYVHHLEMRIATKQLTAPVVFSYEYSVSLNLLGRAGIFKNFRIIFDEKNRNIEFLS